MRAALRKGGLRILAVGIPLLLLQAGVSAGEDEYKVFVDGEEVAAKVPAIVKGKTLLFPGDVAAQRLGVSITWSKKKMAAEHGGVLVRLKNDGGKRGGDVVDGVPRVPARVLQEAFNIAIKWDRVSEKVEVSTTEQYNPFKKETPPQTMAMPEEPIPDFTLSDLDGNPVSFSSFKGKRVALFVFASWDVSRGHLSSWGKYLQDQEDARLAVVGVAVDAQGPKVVERYVKRAEVTFPVLIDRAHDLSRIFGFQNVPVVIVADELGTYKLQIPPHQSPQEAFKRLGSILKQEYRPEFIAPAGAKEVEPRRDVMKRLIKGISEKPNDIYLRLRLAEMYRDEGGLDKAVRQMENATRADPKSAEVAFRWGLYLHMTGKKNEAIARWREAAVHEPKNWLVRKQIWAIEHPERFYRGGIDLAWQQVQIQKGR